MHKLISLIAVTLLFVPYTANAADWTGTLVDTRCMAMDMANTGQDHKAGAMKGCASACAKMGIPVALLVGDKMYTLAAPAPMLADHMAKNATVTGKMLGGSSVIMPAKVVVDGKEVKIGGMM